MEIIILIELFIIIILSYLKDKKFYNPITSLSLIMFILVFLSALRLFDLIETSPYTFFLIGIFMFFITLGYYFITLSTSTFKKTNMKKIVVHEKYKIRYRVVYIVFLIVIFIIIYRLYLVINLLNLGYTFSQIRSNTLNIVEFSNYYSLIYQYIAKPIVFLSIPLGIIDFYIGKKKIIYFTIILIVFLSLVEGGRFILYYFIVLNIISYSIFKSKIKIKKSIMTVSTIITILIILLVYFISDSRGIENYFEHTYLYLAGSIPHLSLRISQIRNYTYGFTFISGFVKPIFVFLNGLGILSYPEFYINVLSYANVEDVVFIANNTTYNAFVTPVFYFYLDFGIIGVILYSIIYGMLLGFSYSLIKRKMNILNLFIFLMIMQGVFTSMVRWQFITPHYALTFIYILLFVKKNNKSKIENK